MTRSLALTLLAAALVGACGDDGSSGPMRDFRVCAEVELDCRDHNDDDCDTRVDCADDDCAGTPACRASGCSGTPIPEACWDDWDDDCDGLPDCADDDCGRSVECNTTCRCVPGAGRWCETPGSSRWGRQACDADATWGACAETAEKPGGCGGGPYDPECCAAVADACCQDAPAAGSIGACAQAVRCE